MAYSHVTLTLPGLTAGEALTQFHVGRISKDTAGKVYLSDKLDTTTVATQIHGVIQNAPASGEEVEFAVDGVTKIKIASTDVAIGDWLSVNSTAQALATTTANRGVIARALEAATGTNDIISALLVGPGGIRY
jgi:hypothetical protein